MFPKTSSLKFIHATKLIFLPFFNEKKEKSQKKKKKGLLSQI
jgi:hypothetical protein